MFVSLCVCWRKDLETFLRKYWNLLYLDGLYVHTDSWTLKLYSPVYIRRLRNHRIPRDLKLTDGLYSLRLTVVFLRNLDEFLAFQDEAERFRTTDLQKRQSNQTDKNVAYDEYLANMYTEKLTD